jgi:hypothetical protein
MASEKHSSGIMEVIAIAALLYFIWRLKNKQIPMDIAPAAINPDEELNPPGFDLNSYCQKVIYKPLTSTNLTIDNPMLPSNWCTVGDNDIIDKSKGFGDPYADKQAEDYTQMKNDEATLIANKNVVQFRLINDTLTKMTTNLLRTTQDVSVFKPSTIYNDFFLPSQDELVGMYNNLYLSGVGGFGANIYHSSTENGGNGSTSIDFSSGGGVYTAKGTSRYVRACRSFIVQSATYAVRDTGPAGGLIFLVVSNGDGTDTCYEAASTDQSAAYPWSNITTTLIGTTGSIIGTGKTNTNAIIAQAGHIASAASLCKALTVTV